MKRIITFALALILLLQPGVEMRAGAEAASPTQVTATDATFSDVIPTEAATSTQAAATASEELSDVPEFIEGSRDVGYEPPDYYPQDTFMNRAIQISKYDARDYGYITPVKNQGIYGTCWTFSATGASEANILKKYGGASDSINLSEIQILWVMDNGPWNGTTYNDPLNNFGGDHGRTDRFYDSDNGKWVERVDVGGNSVFTLSALASWMGVVNENASTQTDYSVMNVERVSSSNLSYDHAFSKDAYHLINARITRITNRDAVKALIMQYGSVSASYLHSYVYFSDFYDSYYRPVGGSGGGHAVSIVGWDDDFPKENFAYANKPAGNGAWLVKNSWGTSWGDNGYFWLSYYNDSKNSADRESIYAWDYEFSDNYDRCYQYDGASGTRYLTVDNGTDKVDAANVFTAAQNEVLSAVSFTLLGNAGVDYTIKVYTGVTSTTDPTAGNLVTTQTGSTTYAGYYTVPLNSPVSLTQNTKFSIVISFDANETLCLSVDASADYAWIKFYSCASAGQSYMKAGSAASWSDISANNMNARIKAFTRDSADYTRGDVNNDKKIDLVDAILICKHICSVATLTDDAAAAADVNRDSAIDYLDVLVISEYIAGKRTL